MSTYLVTGAGRGIGFELTRQLGKLDRALVSKVFATTRGQPSKALSELIAASAGRLIHIPCEVTVLESIEKAVALIGSELSSNGLDVLVNNVGVSIVSRSNILS
jgi:NAD(P)-dependent dehydrogenase (short-subunit alcohol dehydrogenase family)